MKHWEKVIEVKGVKFKLKQLNPFEFSAFKMNYGKAFVEGDMEQLSKTYEHITSWITFDSGIGGFIPVYSKDSGAFTSKMFTEDPSIISEVLDKVVTELLADLLTDTEE